MIARLDVAESWRIGGGIESLCIIDAPPGIVVIRCGVCRLPGDSDGPRRRSSCKPGKDVQPQVRVRWIIHSYRIAPVLAVIERVDQIQIRPIGIDTVNSAWSDQCI